MESLNTKIGKSEPWICDGLYRFGEEIELDTPSAGTFGDDNCNICLLPYQGNVDD